ncbi:MAG: hypothetical protein WCT37_04405 [Patescibacteria group bacterium]|jgi:hypothetical protein
MPKDEEKKSEQKEGEPPMVELAPASQDDAGKVGEVLEETLTSANEKEKKIALEFYFSSHLRADDMDIKQLEKKIKDADVIFVEGLGYNQNVVNHLNALSEAKKPKPSPKDQNHWEALEVAIWDANKPIFIADVPAGEEEDKLLAMEKEHEDLGGQAMKSFYNGNYAEAIDLVRQSLAVKAKWNQVREKIIREEIEQKVEVLKVSEDPRLKDKEAIKVLITYGSFHQNLARDLRREGHNVRTTNAYGVSIFPIQQQVERLGSIGKPVEDFDYARVLLDNIFRDRIFHSIDNNSDNQLKEGSTDKIYLMANKLIEEFSEPDIKELCRLLGEQEGVNKTTALNKFMNTKLDKYFHGAGWIPDQQEEMKRILGNLSNLWEKN